ncbi:MAG: uracil-DNA glycosylase, partial [Deferribacteres bacterium]|nr:uracil-DNA glycosylase [Deferribacteres bacterium]
MWVNMYDRREIRERLRKAMEFYSELGFEYLPVKNITASTGHRLHGEAPAGHIKKDRDEELKNLRAVIGDCRRCKLSEGRKNIVFGEGSPDAGLMFIGEGPGRDEDIQGRPFVGDAGKLLTKLITRMGMKREEVYIANIIKCRPPFNRNPEEDEIAACMPFIEKQIDIIRPRVIVCLGKVSAHALLGTDIPISRLRGTFLQYRGIPVMPTFHPAYLLRNP